MVGYFRWLATFILHLVVAIHNNMCMVCFFRDLLLLPISAIIATGVILGLTSFSWFANTAADLPKLLNRTGAKF